jgi:helicase required for RNAi-mediated heterochromatin assembly 1
VGFTFSDAGIAARIQFSTHRAQRRILWQGSKRLVSGGIVALSPAEDNFKTTCIIAVVAARPLEGLAQCPPEIDIFFVRSEDMHIDPQQEWVMLEAKSGYYEAYRHTLRAIQKLSTESFPMSDHICRLSTDIEAPAYLENRPAVDLSPAADPLSQIGYGTVDVLNSWPSHAESVLDATQFDALHEILSKKLAVIQGPPGTGKTFVSTVALEILNGILAEGDPPIIVAAQTNHALDQLLGHVSKFQPNFIRLGGRSTIPEIKKRALYEVRKTERINLLPGSMLSRATNNRYSLSETLQETLGPFHVDPTQPLALDVFVKHDILSQQQMDSLVEGASRWVSADGVQNTPIELWLGGALFKYELEYEAETFGADEEDEDLEVEQLREQEAETGVNDDEDAEILRGAWCSVVEPWKVSPPTEAEALDAEKILDSSQDLWSLPQGKRGPIYHVMVRRLKSKLLTSFREHAETYDKNLKDLKIGRWERDEVYLKSAKVIGMTTTGLSKYRPLIASLQPKIVLIEEAAEVLEGPVTVACMPSVEHLILVGDHEQLQGHCSVRQLEGEPWHLGVSLFERLVRNEMPYKTLLLQRRMDPEFRELLLDIYPRLNDHSSVRSRPMLECGVAKKAYFFNHSWWESRDTQMSTYNEDEAAFIAGFYRHLVINGVPPSEVTILTFYNGQRKRLLKEIRQYPQLKQEYNNVKTVDSYQGEENTIVILSLARHNQNNRIGFLENQNRVCVALSRAKRGRWWLLGLAATR